MPWDPCHARSQFKEETWKGTKCIHLWWKGEWPGDEIESTLDIPASFHFKNKFYVDIKPKHVWRHMFETYGMFPITEPRDNVTYQVFKHNAPCVGFWRTKAEAEFAHNGQQVARIFWEGGIASRDWKGFTENFPSKTFRTTDGAVHEGRRACDSEQNAVGNYGLFPIDLKAEWKENIRKWYHVKYNVVRVEVNIKDHNVLRGFDRSWAEVAADVPINEGRVHVTVGHEVITLKGKPSRRDMPVDLVPVDEVIGFWDVTVQPPSLNHTISAYTPVGQNKVELKYNVSLPDREGYTWDMLHTQLNSVPHLVPRDAKEYTNGKQLSIHDGSGVLTARKWVHAEKGNQAAALGIGAALAPLTFGLSLAGGGIAAAAVQGNVSVGYDAYTSGRPIHIPTDSADAAVATVKDLSSFKDIFAPSNIKNNIKWIQAIIAIVIVVVVLIVVYAFLRKIFKILN